MYNTIEKQSIFNRNLAFFQSLSGRSFYLDETSTDKVRLTINKNLFGFVINGQFKKLSKIPNNYAWTISDILGLCFEEHHGLVDYDD